MLDEYIFMTIISSPWIDRLIIMQCLSLSLVMVFILKFILSDMSIATPKVLLSFDFCLHGVSYSSPSLSVCVCP